jgi:hypothetical protein
MTPGRTPPGIAVWRSTSRGLSIADRAPQTMTVAAKVIEVCWVIPRHYPDGHMLHFLSSLFKPSAEGAGILDKALIEAATERAIDGTDPRLRALGNYRKRLREPVEEAARHVIALVDGQPAPVEVSRRSYGRDPRLRAFFVSADHLQEVLGEIRTVRDYLQNLSGPLPDAIYGLLTMEWKERTVLGTEQIGEILRRDVKQVAVSFFNHRFAGPAASDAESRWELKKRAYDYLLKVALEAIVAIRSKRRELQREQRLLNRKLATMKAGNWGLEGTFAHDEAEPTDPAVLEVQIDAAEKELLEIGSDTENLQRSLDQLAGILADPAHWIARRELSMRLNYMGIRVEDSAEEASNLLNLLELYSASGERRIVLPACIPRTELPERPDFFKAAQRYLA